MDNLWSTFWSQAMGAIYGQKSPKIGQISELVNKNHFCLRIFIFYPILANLVRFFFGIATLTHTFYTHFTFRGRETKIFLTKIFLTSNGHFSLYKGSWLISLRFYPAPQNTPKFPIHQKIFLPQTYVLYVKTDKLHDFDT